ncbi:hypothetical protein ABZ302_29380 [Streptomyces sp. NPDC006237]|uniref:hypothetical protein n=1 Tax=Streptomyces sp. NPDC006237 TaxID=3154474 RepID=UPI00339EE466
MDAPTPSPRPRGGTDPDAGVGPEGGSTAGAPRWVKVFGSALIAALIVAFVLMHALGGAVGGH